MVVVQMRVLCLMQNILKAQVSLFVVQTFLSVILQTRMSAVHLNFKSS